MNPETFEYKITLRRTGEPLEGIYTEVDEGTQTATSPEAAMKQRIESRRKHGYLDNAGDYIVTWQAGGYANAVRFAVADVAYTMERV